MSFNNLLVQRLSVLDATLRAASIPIDGVSFVNPLATPPTVRVDYAAAATPAQKTSGASIVTAFQWDQAAQDGSNITSARAGAGDLLSAFNSAQATLFRAVAAVLVDEINILRAAVPRGIISITRTVNTATATCPDPHGLTTGDTVRIQGATLAAYNVTATVTVTSTTVFTYAVVGSPVTPAVGSISFTLGVVPSMAPRTLAQARTAILAKISAGLVDS